MNKKTYTIFAVVIAFVIIAGILLISNINFNKNEVESGTKINVTTSFYPMYIMTSNLLNNVEGVSVKNLTSTFTGCVHDYTLTPDEMISLSKADYLVVNGSNMEAFLDRVISNYPTLNILDTSKGVDVILEEEHGLNSHTFVSISNYLIQINNLSNDLVQAMPDKADKIMQNLSKYVEDVEKLNALAHEKLDKYANSNVIALHDSFEYFAKDFGINVIDVIEMEEGVAASATNIASIIDEINENNVKVIIVDKDNSSNIPSIIAKETGCNICYFNPTISGTDNLEQYITQMEENIYSISKAFEE